MEENELNAVLYWALRRAVDLLPMGDKVEIYDILQDSGLAYGDDGHLIIIETGVRVGPED